MRVFSTDLSQLYAERLKLTNPNDHMILPEIISKEPLGPAVRHGDDQWLDIARWTHFAMVNGEELGVSSKNIAEAMKSDRPDVMRFVGTEGKLGEQLGLSKNWAERIIRLVGNYGEVFERNLGSGSRLEIARGVNNLWNKGGIQYAPPLRCREDISSRCQEIFIRAPVRVGISSESAQTVKRSRGGAPGPFSTTLLSHRSYPGLFP